MNKWWTRENIDDDFIIESETREEIVHVPLSDMSYLDKNIFWKYLAISELFRAVLSREHDIFVFVSELIEHNMGK